jgi:uncharacterized protein HemY
MTQAKIDDIRRPDATVQLSKLRKKRLWRPLIGAGTELLRKPGEKPSARIHAEVAKAYLEVRQYDLAREHLVAAKSLRPDSPVVLRRFAELEFAEGNFEAAAELWLSLKKKKASAPEEPYS